MLVFIQKRLLHTYKKGQNQYENAKFGLRMLYQNKESIANAQGIQAESNENIYKHINYKTNKQYIPPDFKILKKYFLEKGSDANESEKFYNYNQARGWKNIEDWKPLAANWILKNNNQLKQQKNEYSKDFRQNGTRFDVEEQDYSARF